MKPLIKLKPVAEQQRLLSSDVRYKVVVAGRRSGKSLLAKYDTIRKLIKPGLYGIAAPTMQQVKDIYWDDLLNWIPVEWITSVNVQSLTIKTIFGSTLKLIGLDRPQRVEGVGFNDIKVDESSDVKPDAWKLSILPALVDNNGTAWRMGVPKRSGCGAKEFKEMFDKGNDPKINDIESFHWKSKDVYPKEEIEKFNDFMTDQDFREQFEASWETSSDLVFYAFDDTLSVMPYTYNKDKPIIVGQDFNVNPMSWVLLQRDNEKIYAFDEIFIRDTNTHHTLDYLYNKYKEHKHWIFIGDASGRSRKTSASQSDFAIIHNDERFIKQGRQMLYDKSNPAVKDRIASTNAKLCNGRQVRTLFIDPKCEKLIDDLKFRHYKSGTMDISDTGDLGHMTDALSYVIYKLYPILNKIETIDKPIIFAKR